MPSSFHRSKIPVLSQKESKSMSRFEVLTVKEFAEVIGTTPDDIPLELQKQIEATDFSYQTLSQAEHDNIVLRVLKQLDADSFAKVGQERLNIWEKAWGERAQHFIEGDYELTGLTPNYVDANPIVRLNRRYVLPQRPDFERNFSEIFRQWLFKK